ncbi:MAG TPA: pentapeptide repeat-containing protein [Pseudobacteroides sp.]|uniref:pentapeptide repeat-containing protein n=1 Tax=Pseudobacteroides sp. TaxID=1968840 RepID=UPI002F94AB3A
MKRFEAIGHFNDNYVLKIREKKLGELSSFYETNKNILAQGMLDAFKNLCIKAGKLQQEGIKDSIAHICFSLLRIRILEKRHNYRLDAFSDLYYLDKTDCTVEYDAAWAYKYLDEFMEELEQSRKLYMNKVLKPDIERIMFKEISYYNDYIVNLARLLIPEAVKLDEYIALKRQEVVDISVGEYKASSCIVYKEDRRVKNSGDIKSWLEGKYEYGYRSEILKDLDLSEGDYEGIDLAYSDFTGSNLTGSSFKNAQLSGAVLCNTNLEGVNFENVDLRCCDLRGAILKNVNFNKANLKDAMVSGSDAQSLALDQEQRKNIIII